MSGTVFLICGGKSFYAERLRKEKSAALLSVDEITLALFECPAKDEIDVWYTNDRKSNKR